jgi:hypothetical protein
MKEGRRVMLSGLFCVLVGGEDKGKIGLGEGYIPAHRKVRMNGTPDYLYAFVVVLAGGISVAYGP